LLGAWRRSIEDAERKLDQGSGVICPPNVDPGIKAPTPETGKMPVIPPPGSSGGDPNVQPK
jgi:quercetin dioxygenase-like cupin family protein